MIVRPRLGPAALLAGTGLLAACAGMEGAGGIEALPERAETALFEPITTEAAFRDRVAGREVVYDNGATGSYGADNTWTVTRGGEVVAEGGWVWRDDRWCYTGRVRGEPIAPRCDRVEVSPNAVRFTQEDGTVGVLRFRT